MMIIATPNVADGNQRNDAKRVDEKYQNADVQKPGRAAKIQSPYGQSQRMTQALDACKRVVAGELRMGPERVNPARLRILVVESDRAIRELLTESLTVPVQEATSVSNSSKALGLLAQSHFDLMLVAYSLSEFGSFTLGTNSLPKPDGLDLAKTAHKDDPSLKIVMLTSSDGEALSTAMTNRIVDAIISQPFSLSDVEGAVASLCAS